MPKCPYCQEAINELGMERDRFTIHKVTLKECGCLKYEEQENYRTTIYYCPECLNTIATSEDIALNFLTNSNYKKPKASINRIRRMG